MLLVRRSKRHADFCRNSRATVAPADCDHLGLMNVQHYLALNLARAPDVGIQELRRLRTRSAQTYRFSSKKRRLSAPGLREQCPI
jgi:hypothetical protein